MKNVPIAGQMMRTATREIHAPRMSDFVYRASIQETLKGEYSIQSKEAILDEIR
jgi:hypothetical protein